MSEFFAPPADNDSMQEYEDFFVTANYNPAMNTIVNPVKKFSYTIIINTTHEEESNFDHQCIKDLLNSNWMEIKDEKGCNSGRCEWISTRLLTEDVAKRDFNHISKFCGNKQAILLVEVQRSGRDY